MLKSQFNSICVNKVLHMPEYELYPAKRRVNVATFKSQAKLLRIRELKRTFSDIIPTNFSCRKFKNYWRCKTIFRRNLYKFEDDFLDMLLKIVTILTNSKRPWKNIWLGSLTYVRIQLCTSNYSVYVSLIM